MNPAPSVQRCLCDETSATAIEYALIASLIGVAGARRDLPLTSPKRGKNRPATDS